jgi:hypothetical protein
MRSVTIVLATLLAFTALSMMGEASANANQAIACYVSGSEQVVAWASAGVSLNPHQFYAWAEAGAQVTASASVYCTTTYLLGQDNS